LRSINGELQNLNEKMPDSVTASPNSKSNLVDISTARTPTKSQPERPTVPAEIVSIYSALRR
jgi:hypothetical protein